MSDADASARWAWADVDLDAIAHNVEHLRAVVAPSAVWAVVKANGYGHGAVEVARAAMDAGAQGLCVALAEEGAQLRVAGIDAPILVLSEQPVEAADDIVRFRLMATVYTVAFIDALAAAAVVGLAAAAIIASNRHDDHHHKNDDKYYDSRYNDSYDDRYYDSYRGGNHGTGRYGYNGYGGDPRWTFNCASRSDRREYCNIPARGHVEVYKQRSSSPCTHGRSWGVKGDRVWVEDGCRAEFAVF